MLAGLSVIRWRPAVKSQTNAATTVNSDITWHTITHCWKLTMLYCGQLDYTTVRSLSCNKRHRLYVTCTYYFEYTTLLHMPIKQVPANDKAIQNMCKYLLFLNKSQRHLLQSPKVKFDKRLWTARQQREWAQQRYIMLWHWFGTTDMHSEMKMTRTPS